MKNAPHLPPKTCRIDTYQRLQNIKWILLFAVFAFIAGGSAAIMFNAWLAPNYDFSAVWTNNNPERSANKNQPASSLERQVRQRLLTIHDKRKKAGGEFYSRESFVANAAIVSSDGWAVALVPNYSVGLEKNWEIMDYKRVIYQLERTTYDRLEHLLYFKVKGEGLRVFSFPRWEEVAVGMNLWSVGFAGWQETFIKENSRMTDKNLFIIWQPQYNFQVADKIAAGDLLFNDQGELLAIGGVGNTATHGWLVEEQIRALLAFGKLSYRGLPWQGYFVQGAMQEQVNNILGFYVEKSPTFASAVSVGKGDVIFKINGESLEQEKLAQQLWLAQDDFKVTVLREGKEIEVAVKKTAVTP